MVAKAADIPVNQLFSENVSVEELEETEFLLESETFEETTVLSGTIISEKNFDNTECFIVY